MTDQKLQEVYFLSRHPEVRALKEISEVNDRLPVGRKLMERGILVDYDADIYQVAAPTVMRLRLARGWRWMPGLDVYLPPERYHELAVLPAPHGSILTVDPDNETDWKAAYPPFDPPPPPPTVPVGDDAVGQFIGLQKDGDGVDTACYLYYGTIPPQDGVLLQTKTRGVYRIRKVLWSFGFRVYLEKVA